LDATGSSISVSRREKWRHSDAKPKSPNLTLPKSKVGKFLRRELRDEEKRKVEKE